MSGRAVRLLWRALAAILPATPAGRSILGDLIEDFHRRPAGWRRTLWLAICAAQLTLAYLPPRLSAVRVSGSALRGAGSDLKSAVRSLQRDRRPAILAVLALAVGAGAMIAILSVVYGSLLRPLPFADPASLIVIGDRSLDRPVDEIAGNIALPNLRDAAAGSPAVRAFAAYCDTSVTIAGMGEARLLRAQEVEAPFFDVLGTPMIMGRGFAASDADERVVILSEGLWRQQFGTRSVLGSTVLVNAVPHVVIGVAGRATQLGNPALWRPLVPSAILNRRTARQVYAIARVETGVATAVVAQQLNARFADVRARHPEIAAERAVGVMPIHDWLVGREGPRLLYVLSAVAASVLVVACLNAALLMVVRTEHRQPELSLRMALGASRFRIVRLLVAEGLVLALAAAALGLVFAAWTTRLLVRLYGAAFPRAWEIELHPPVVTAALVVAVGVTLLIALLPVVRLRGSRPQRIEGLTRGQPVVRLSQRVLIAAQAAGAVVFLVTGGLVVQSVWNLARQDLGVTSADALVFDLSLVGRHKDAASARASVAQILDRLRSLPGVTGAAFATRRPLMGGGNSGFSLPGRPDATSSFVEIRSVTPDYFGVLGMRILDGRGLSPEDSTTGAPVVVNEAFARRFLPDGAVDQAMTMGRTFTIVGVVSDIREFGPGQPARPTAYWAFGNGPFAGMLGLTGVLRVEGRAPLSLVGAARAAIASVDSHIALDDPITLQDLAITRAGRDRLAARTLLVLAAVMAVALTALGLYGVVAFSVAIRRKEIGIRRALGAPAARVVRLFVRQGLGHAAPGILLGVPLAGVAARGVAAYLYGVEPGDPLTIAASASGVLLLSAAASWMAARRSAAVDATVALLRE